MKAKIPIMRMQLKKALQKKSFPLFLLKPFTTIQTPVPHIFYETGTYLTIRISNVLGDFVIQEGQKKRKKPSEAKAQKALRHKLISPKEG